MHWIDSIPPIAPLIENIGNEQVRLYYRGAEPIKAFAVYSVPYNEESYLSNATLTKILVADKTVDIDLNSVSSNANDKIFVAAIDRNNNISEWVQLR